MANIYLVKDKNSGAAKLIEGKSVKDIALQLAAEQYDIGIPSKKDLIAAFMPAGGAQAQ